jgi:hypothetical protein
MVMLWTNKIDCKKISQKIGTKINLRKVLLSLLNSAESESYVTTDGQPASLSWNKAPIWGLRPDFCYCQTVVGLLMWGSLSL